MKRLSVMAALASTLLLAGCGLHDYNSRMEGYVRELKEVQARDQYLEPAAEGKFKELNVYLRVPKRATQSGIANLPPGSFDEAVAFLCTAPVAAPTGEGQTEPAPLPPLKVLTFVRKKPGKPAAKKGEAPPPADPNLANRGDFIADVKAAIAPEFGPEVEKTAQAEKRWKTYKFTASNGDDVRVYFVDANKGELQVALIFAYPATLRTAPIVEKAVPLCLKSFEVGRAANAVFNKKGPGAAGKAGGEGF